MVLHSAMGCGDGRYKVGSIEEEASWSMPLIFFGLHNLFLQL